MKIDTTEMMMEQHRESLSFVTSPNPRGLISLRVAYKEREKMCIAFSSSRIFEIKIAFILKPKATRSFLRRYTYKMLFIVFT
jgi:hypothetical protein